MDKLRKQVVVVTQTLCGKIMRNGACNAEAAHNGKLQFKWPDKLPVARNYIGAYITSRVREQCTRYDWCCLFGVN